MKRTPKTCRRCLMHKSVYGVCQRCTSELLMEALDEREADGSSADFYDVVKTYHESERLLGGLWT